MMKFYQCKECGEIIAVREGGDADLTGKEVLCLLRQSFVLHVPYRSFT